MRKPLTATALIVASTASFGAAEPPEQPYEWTCKATGFYEMKVTPDGVAHPIADTTPLNPIHIVIQRRSKDGMETYGKDLPLSLGELDVRYTVSLTSADSQLPFMTLGPIDFYDSGVRFSFPFNLDAAARRQGLYGVDATYWEHHTPHILELHTAERDWVFSVYSGSLTTDSQARQANIKWPLDKRGMRWEAHADVYFLTGPCVRDR